MNFRSVLLRAIDGRLALFVFGGLVLSAFAGCGGETSGGSGNGAMGGTAGAGAQGGTDGNGGAGNGGNGGNLGSAGFSGGGSAGYSGGGSAGFSGGAASGGTGGLPPDWQSCTDISECMIREATCCATCGIQDARNAIAFNRKYGDEVTRAVCGANPPPCPAIACQQTPAYVLPFCLEGRCQAIDIRQDKLTSCSNESQCRLRWDTGCCEPCGNPPITMLVAVNSQVNYSQTVCGSSIGCPDCVTAPYPTHARALCGPDNHCAVGLLR
jgi:hypothetical protein